MSQIYSKDSFDRFGDDLCEVLLSYLSFEDRFRCESVSKQIQRVVYKTQSELSIDDKLWLKVSPKGIAMFETIVKKLKHMESIELYYKDKAMTNKMLAIVGKHCHHLNELSVYTTQDSFSSIDGIELKAFCDKYGQQLETILFMIYGNRLNAIYFTQTLKTCENVRKITISSNIAKNSLFSRLFCVKNEIHFKKLETIELTLDDSGCDPQNRLKTIKPFVRNYRQKLRSIDVSIDFMDEDLLSNVMKCLSRMHELIHLRLTIRSGYLFTYHTLIDDLTRIGVNCRQLKRLELNDIILDISLDAIITAINTAFGPHIRRLKISGHFGSPVTCNARLNACKRLTRLKVFDKFSELSFDPFVPNIATDLPQLRYLSLPTTTVTDETDVNVLSHLTRLHSLRVDCSVDQQLLCNTIRSICPNVENIDIKLVKPIEDSDNNNECLII